MSDVSPINWKGAIVIGKLIYAYHGHCPLSDSDTTLGTKGRKARWMPYAPLRPTAAGPFGNTGKHRPADWYLSAFCSLTILTEILRCRSG